MSHLVIIFLLFGCAFAAVSDWAYTKEVSATDGRPCLNDCKNDRCVIDYNGNYKECIPTEIQAPKYRTAEVKQKKREYCLSNCGFFGYDFEWCLVSNDRAWDYCNSSKKQRSVYKVACKEACDTHFYNYYWCYVESGSWHYCALPREESGLTQVENATSIFHAAVKENKTEIKVVKPVSDDV